MITEQNLICIAAAWSQLKDNPNQTHYVSYNTDHKRLSFVMERKSWYYGNYATFIDGVFFCSFTEQALDFITRSHFYGAYPEYMKMIHKTYEEDQKLIDKDKTPSEIESGKKD